MATILHFPTIRPEDPEPDPPAAKRARAKLVVMPAAPLRPLVIRISAVTLKRAA
jgi:hypothetical protein